MKPSETEALYTAACKAKRLVPQKEEGRMWHKALSLYEARDVQAALDKWWASTETNVHGELKSKWLPAPGELKPLVEEVARKRLRAASVPKQCVHWKCPRCGVRMSGCVPETDLRGRKCPGCTAPMNEEERKAA